MKKIKTLRGETIYVRCYGDEKTKLRLSDAAEAAYDQISPLDIFEEEAEDGPRYYLRGAIESDGYPWGDGMTVEDVESLLIEFATVEEEDD